MALTKATYSMINGGFLNVLDYGAVGDGVTDDITAINNAIAYAKATPNIKGVFFPSGNYKITSSIDARGNFGTGLELWGFRATITSTGDVPALKLNGRVPDTPPEVRMHAYVHGFVFQGPGKANTSSVGIEVARGANVVVKDCQMYGFYKGLYCFGNLISNYENLSINDCFYGMDIAPDGIEFAPNDLHFLHCQVYDNDRVLRAVGFPNGAMTFIGCELEGNNLSGNTTDGAKVIEFSNAGKTTLLGCHIEQNPGQYNIFYSSNKRSLNIIGCEIIPGDDCGTVVEISNANGYAELFVEGSRVTNNVGVAQINVQTNCSAFIIGDTAGYVVGAKVNRVYDGRYASNSHWILDIGGPGSLERLQLNRGGTSYALEPGVDNAQNLGTGGIRWATVYAVTPTINTSDGREKQHRELSEIEKAVAVKCKSLIRAFKFNDAIEIKGDGARIHFGVIAQDIKAAFDSEGLDANKYGLFCYDEWEADPENGIKAGNRYGVRYEELLAFIIAAL